LPRYLALVLTVALCFAFAASVALYPAQDGITVLTDQDTAVDASHIDQGYVMVSHAATKKALKLRLIKGDSTYTYDLAADGRYETFPLTLGSGTYKLQVFRQVSGKRYTNDASLSFSVELTDEAIPFLYPNQYVWYSADSTTVQKSNELCQNLESDTEKLKAIRAYITKNIKYDYTLAATVQSGYLPSVDDTLKAGKGICFDYAAVTACMLRVQGIPTQLVIGWADSIYHAWNKVQVDGQWLRVDTTADANNMKVKKYTEERIY